MAGTLRPSSDLLQSDKEAGYIIHGYVLYDQAENLFNGGITTVSPAPFKGTVSRTNTGVTYWAGTGAYLDIEFLNDTKIWDAGGEVAYIGSLDIFANDNGIKGSMIDTLKEYTKTYNATSPNWQDIATLKKGRYRIESGGSNRISNEWYLEDIGNINKTLILHDGEYKRWNEGREAILGGETIPVMTSDSLPSGLVETTGSYLAGGYDAFKAFGKATTNLYFVSSDNPVYPFGLSYTFPSAKVINKYSIKASTATSAFGYCPKDWTFDGWNGNQWVLLDTINNQTAWTSSQIREFSINNTLPFIKYRLNMQSNNGGAYNRVGNIVDFQMFEAPSEAENPKLISVSTILPISAQFQTEGMDSLSPLLDRRVETLEPLQMSSKSEILPSGEEGKMFSQTINLKKYLDIRNIKVEVK